MTRPSRFAAIVVVALAARVAPATPHEEFSPSSVGIGRSVFLTFSAANERQVAITSVTLASPAGLVLGPVTREPQGWAVTRGQAELTWSGGQLAPGRFEQWGVELEAPDQAGTFIFRSTLRFADGRTDAHDVPLTVLSANPAGAAPPPASVAPTAQRPVAAAPATLSADPPPAAQRPVAAGGGLPATRTQANVALALGGAGLLLSLVALVVAAIRRRPGDGSRPSPPTEQQW